MPTTNSTRSKLNELYDEYKLATKEAGFDTRDTFVWGDGLLKSKVMLIGEAPGKNEIIEGRPFVGPAGKMLSEFLIGAGIERKELFITNAMKYRLGKEGKRPGVIVNRPATKQEIFFANKFLIREIEILKPIAVVTLGNVPLKTICLNAPEIGKIHGILLEEIFDSKKILLYPMYHPASVIYNHELKEIYKKDLKKFKKFLSEKF